MKDKFPINNIKQFIDTEGYKGDEIIERKYYSETKINIKEDEERTVICYISTDAVDADGDIIYPYGADFTRFQKNPVIHVDHSYKTEDVVGKGLEWKVDDHGILCKIQFADCTQKAKDTWELIKNGFVKTHSIGFIAKEILIKGSKEFSNFIVEKKLEVNDRCRRIIKAFELIESSIVSIPSNAEALNIAISSKSINISEELQKELKLNKELPIVNKDEIYGELVDITLKPFPNEHAARQNSPDKYVRFRRKNDAFGPGINVIYGITSDGKAEIQSIRFSVPPWTVEKAKEWLKEHNYKTDVEPANGDKPKEATVEAIKEATVEVVETSKVAVDQPKQPIINLKILRSGFDINKEAKDIINMRKGKVV